MVTTSILGQFSSIHLQKMCWGYSICGQEVDSRVLELNEIERRNLLAGEHSCVDQKLLEKELKKVSAKKDIPPIGKKNNKGYIKWLYAHPDCVVKTHYQKWCEQFVCDLSVVMAVQAKEECDLSLLTFISADDACNLGLDAIKVALDRVCQLDVGTTITQHGCELGAQVFLAKNYCNISSEIKIESVDCKLGAEATISENKCDITQDFRVGKSTCKLAHSAFISEHGCNLDFKRFIKATKGLNNCF